MYTIFDVNRQYCIQVVSNLVRKRAISAQNSVNFRMSRFTRCLFFIFFSVHGLIFWTTLTTDSLTAEIWDQVKPTITTLHTVAEKALSVKKQRSVFSSSIELRYLSCQGNMKFQPEQYQTSSHHACKKRNHFRSGKLSITVWAMKACPQKGILSLLM